MSSHTSTVVGDKVYTITSHVVTGLNNRRYLEFRLEERDETGAFLGFCAMGSREFCEEALERREEEAGSGITPEGQALGHRYVMGEVNAYCPKCSEEQGVCVLDCDWDLDK